jgi:Fe-S cluster biogenesis protein NfuA
MSDEEILHRISGVLEQIRPNIQMDGGDIEFVKFEDGVVYIRMSGACIGCPAAIYTLKMGIEERIKEQVPDVLEVMSID